MTKQEKLLLIINFTLYGFLTIFSYAYVDLNLTISQNQTALKFVNFMQKLGYYDRPLATQIYLAFLTCAFVTFIVNLYLTHKNMISKSYLKISTLTNTFILIFAYPFLSSDLFNYLFDAKIMLKYHASPYTHRALDFENDEWLRFMRWVHRYSPYGPFWLGISLIPAILGFGKFIVNFLAFKIFIGAFHILNSFIIYRTLQKISPKLTNFGTIFYALNPLFLIEGVANAHNDVVLTAFLLSCVLFFSLGKTIPSYAAIIFGTLIKYIPILNLPWLVLAHKKGQKNINQIILLNMATMAAFTYLYSSFRITVPFVSSGSTQVQFQPWYLFWTLPYIALIPKLNLTIIATALSIGASLRYVPYLYYGDWSQPGTISFMTFITLTPTVLALLIMLTCWKIAKK